jgi:hypothetical protein
MTSKFLSLLFSEAEFPTPVGDHIISRYATSYLKDIALSLELCKAELFRREVDADTVCLLLCSSRNNVLNAVLDTDECRDQVLVGILNKYELSDTDQLRFASRNVSPYVAEVALGQQIKFPPARDLLMKRCGWTTDGDADQRPYYRSRLESTTGYPSSGRAPRSIDEDACVPINTALDAIYLYDALHLGPFLIREFGDGSFAESLSQWEAFFMLASDAGNIALKTVISTAKTMAYANK